LDSEPRKRIHPSLPLFWDMKNIGVFELSGR
jgi:hypothetical protein